MVDIISEFGNYICKETPRHPLRSRKLLLTAYRAYGLMQKVAPNPALTPARKYLATLCMDAVVSSFARPGRSALVSIFLPCELLEAFRIRAMCAEQFATYINGAMAEKVFVEAAENAGLAETFCSYHKVLMGAALSGVLPPPGFILNTSLVCDANNLTFRALAEHYGVPQYYVDVPYRKDADSVAYVAEQLRGMAAFLEERTGRKLNQDRLRAALDRSRRTIDTLQNAVPLRRVKYLPGDLTSEMYEALAVHTRLGSAASLKYSELLLEDLNQAGPARGVRLLWIHTVPYWQEPLQAMLNASEKCQIITCDICYDTFGEIDPDRPFESMARRLVYDPLNGPASDRIQAAADMGRALDVDGAVCFCHWGCKETMGASAAIKEGLEAQGFPTLILNGDGCDRSNSSDGQISTRLAAFLEMLEERKK